MTKQECITYVEAHLETRYATKNGAYKAKRFITPVGAVNHSIGVAQPSADVIFNLMNKESSGWGVNAILGDFHLGEGKIILAMPLTARPWGCGAGKKGSWNNSKVQWEVCEPAGHTYSGGTMVNYDAAKNQAYFDRMWKMLVAWNVYCVMKLGYPVSGISDHAEASRAGYGSAHADMGQWLPKHGKSMDVLRKEVQDILDGVQEDDDMDLNRFTELMNEYRATLRDNDSGDWSKESRQWAISTGLVKGSGTLPNGEPNYLWEDMPTRETLVEMMYRFAKMMGQA